MQAMAEQVGLLPLLGIAVLVALRVILFTKVHAELMYVSVQAVLGVQRIRVTLGQGEAVATAPVVAEAQEIQETVLAHQVFPIRVVRVVLGEEGPAGRVATMEAEHSHLAFSGSKVPSEGLPIIIKLAAVAGALHRGAVALPLVAEEGEVAVRA